MLPERRHDISRLEAFSDAVFAFALTLLVVSRDVPKTYAELISMMTGFIPFAVFDVRASLGAHLVSASVGLVAVMVALFAPMPLPLLSGFTYFLMGPAHWVFGVTAGRRRRAFESGVAVAAV